VLLHRDAGEAVITVALHRDWRALRHTWRGCGRTARAHCC
jgi:hypothetical protein